MIAVTSASSSSDLLDQAADYMTEITQYVQTQGAMKEIWTTGGKMLLCTLGSGHIRHHRILCRARAARLSQRVREMLFSRVEAFSMEEIALFNGQPHPGRPTISRDADVRGNGMQVVLKARLWRLGRRENFQQELGMDGADGGAVLVLSS